MVNAYLSYLGITIALPDRHTYADLGWTTDLEGRIAQFESRLGMKPSHKRKNISGKFFVAGSALKYRDRKTGMTRLATVYASPEKASVAEHLKDYYRTALAAHEQAHIASMTGNTYALEQKYGLNLRGRSEEDIANLVSLAVLEQKALRRGKSLEEILYSDANPGGILITNSTRKPKMRVQKRYHNRILREYFRQRARHNGVPREYYAHYAQRRAS
ncbi:hypothetical protein D6764_01560 [Candidatus Woesearchaeota archaeon]|nr:MAG: hypothetical protein D6764_01560 [Candidatus Woesearchaeota archaeon]